MNPYLKANSVHALFNLLPRKTIRRISERVKRASKRSALTYTDEHGKTALITLTLRPRILDRGTRTRLWRIVRTLDGAFRKIAPLYSRIPSLDEIFPFDPAEKPWIRILEEPGTRPGSIVSRWDANTAFSTADWRQGFSFFEVNGVGVGGLWYGPASAEVALAEVVPALRRLDPHFKAVLGDDMRRLLLASLMRHRQLLGRRRGVIAMVMEKASGSNYIEFERLAAFFTRLGCRSIVTEPTDFTVRNNEITARGKTIDILYRDTTLSELCAFEAQGHDMAAMREACRRGQVISSLEGEFDHKSAFEVFTHPDYARFFSGRERKLFRDHILWTRLLREVKTTDPRGARVDLIPFTLKHRENLVLKPNRLYGGKGVLFGREAGRRAWERKIDQALAESGGWVIQKLGELRSKRFYRPDGAKVREGDCYVVSGFFANHKGLGIVGRMSEKKVVNVARRGGLTPVLVLA